MAGADFKPGELVMAAMVSRRYFIDGKAKTEIADEFKISRFRVARILERARETGIVRVEINLPAEIDAEASDQLRAAYSLRRAIAVATSDSPEESLRSHLGAVAAGLLSEIVQEGDVLGIAWGRTIDAMINAVEALARCTAVQLTGATGHMPSGDSLEAVRRVASLSGGPLYPLYVPLIVDTAEAATALRRQPLVAKTLQQFERLTKAVVAVGSWDPPNSQLFDVMEPAARSELGSLGVRAEISGILLNDAGHVVRCDLANRIVAISASQLRRVPEVMVVAGGRSKLQAMQALLRAKLATSVITDAVTARTLVERATGSRTARRRGERPAKKRETP
jgi:DNA-binding transcriptional regulator LsrR (DeoR family)